MDALGDQLTLPELHVDAPEALGEVQLLAHEWLATNGLGGYAAGTIGGAATRKYHGLFIPSLPRLGRTLMLARLGEVATVDGRSVTLDAYEDPRGVQAPSPGTLVRFRLHGLIPEWHLAFGNARLVRRLLYVHGENTVFLTWQLASAAGPVQLSIRPFLAFRSHEGALHRGELQPTARADGFKVELRARPDALPLRTAMRGASFTPDPASLGPLRYRVEQARGYEALETLASPGHFDCTLAPGETVAFGATVGGWELLERDPEQLFALEAQREQRLLTQARVSLKEEPTAARLVLAADQFLIEPAHRTHDEAWARASGLPLRSVIAGYPWFTDWGRDTMISLEGLTIATGRHPEANAVLRTFAHHLRDGLIPNYFPDGENEGVYHTADATLWYFHALARYLAATNDGALLTELFPLLADVVHRHEVGTRFGIRVDPRDGLLTQGQDGYQLTWMDAKVDGWVVTPRRGKAVELNALWFNALKLMGTWAPRVGADATRYMSLAERAYVSFNARFWNEAKACLYDVVDCERGGDDPAVRPNQVFAISLSHPVLQEERWAPVLAKVRERLLTPVGLRTLSPTHPDFQRAYDGDLRARDAAYHQGTVWPWLLGHFVDATVRASGGDVKVGRELLEGLTAHLHHACLGQVSEVFDATEPYRPRGCFAQAWSVAEFLRVLLATRDKMP